MLGSGFKSQLSYFEPSNSGRSRRKGTLGHLVQAALA